MSTIISLHIKSDNRTYIAKLLQELSHVNQMTHGAYPKELDKNILIDDKANPTYMAVGNVQNGWTTVQINSFKKLHNWMNKISEELETTVIQIMGQTVSDVYYFIMYDKGNMRREIEIYHGDFNKIIDKGEKFPFEKPSLIPADDEDYEDLFDIDTLEQYCKELGFNLFCEEPPEYYFILRNQKLPKAVKDYTTRNKNAKPWWRFW